MDATNETTSPERERLRFLLLLTGLTANALSKLLGLSAAHIGMILRGDIKSVSRDVARALARMTGCSVGWLLAGEGAPPTADEVRRSLALARGESQPLNDASGLTRDEATGPRVDRSGDYSQVAAG